jgi:hypothetical protein
MSIIDDRSDVAANSEPAFANLEAAWCALKTAWTSAPATARERFEVKVLGLKSAA